MKIKTKHLWHKYKNSSRTARYYYSRFWFLLLCKQGDKQSKLSFTRPNSLFILNGTLCKQNLTTMKDKEAKKNQHARISHVNKGCKDLFWDNEIKLWYAMNKRWGIYRITYITIPQQHYFLALMLYWNKLIVQPKMS